MPSDIYNSLPFSHSRVWDLQSRRAGYRPAPSDGIWNWDVIRAELQGRSRPSAINGESNLGNANGAKYDLRQNYLRIAEQSGKLRIHPGHQVSAIGRESDGRYRVEVTRVAPTGEVLGTDTITTDRLFLGAGSIGSSELLVAAQATGALPDLNEHIGHDWDTNGDAALVRGLQHDGMGGV